MNIQGEDGMERAAAAFVESLQPHPSGATIVTLSGELGAGKTTFARGVLRRFGVEGSVTSPTFVIMKIYEPPRGPWRRIVHMDAYRLKGKHHLEILGWNEMSTDPKTLILMEWPEMVEEAVPENALKIVMHHSDGDTREMVIKGGPTITT